MIINTNYRPIRVTKSDGEDFNEDACLNLSALREYHNNMDFRNFIIYFTALCEFIRESNFKYKYVDGLWHHKHKCFNCIELSMYFTRHYYNKPSPKC